MGSEMCIGDRAGVEPKVVPIRGGTDGARLSYMGLPCPNLGTGGFAFHGPYEHITVEGMDIAARTLIEIVKIYSERQEAYWNILIYAHRTER